MTLESRIAQLEQSNRRMRVCTTLMMMAVPIGALLAAQGKPSDTLKASVLEITDAQGTVRARFNADGLSLLNSQGVPQLMLTVVSPDGKDSAGMIAVVNHAMQSIVTIEQGADGAGTIISRRKDGKENIVLGAYPTGGVITLKDNNDHLACAMGFGSWTTPKFMMLPPSGRGGVMISTEGDGANLMLRDANGKTRVSLSATKDLAMASVLDSGEGPGISLMNAKGKGNHVLVHRDNGTTWIAPSP